MKLSILIEEVQTIEGFIVYPFEKMVDPTIDELTEEYKEEIGPAIVTQGHPELRWGISKQEALQIFGNLKHFLQVAETAKPIVIPPSKLMETRNYSQVTQIIRAYLRNQNINQKTQQAHQERFFKSVDASGEEERARQKEKGHTKYDSYLHKVELIRNSGQVTYPMMLYYNNELSHISGHTRQTAAVTQKIILPVKVIVPTGSERAPR